MMLVLTDVINFATFQPQCTRDIQLILRPRYGQDHRVKDQATVDLSRRRQLDSSRGRGLLRFSTMRCCRRHRFSATKWDVDLKQANIAHKNHRNTRPISFLLVVRSAFQISGHAKPLPSRFIAQHIQYGARNACFPRPQCQEQWRSTPTGRRPFESVPKQKPRAREPSRDDVGCGFFDKRAARGRRGEPNPKTQHHDQRNLCPQHCANQIAKPMDQSTDAE